MEKSALNELLKTKTPNQILTKHILGEIFLTNSQLDKIIKLKDGTIEEGHGGVNTKKISNYKKEW